jgi:transcriptional regulator of heat shock response
MSVNEVTVSGKLKSIKEYKNERGTLMLAIITQRNEFDSAVFTMPVVIHNDDVQKVVRKLNESRNDSDYTQLVKVTGQLNTRFDKEPGKDASDRKAPFTRIVAEQVELV